MRRALAADRRSVAAVEFALVGMILLMLIFGIIELGQVAAAQSALDRGVEAAARWAAVNSAGDTAAAVAQQFTAAVQPVLGGVNPAPAVAVTFSGGAATIGGTVRVSASYTWTPATGMAPFAATLAAQTVVTILH